MMTIRLLKDVMLGAPSPERVLAGEIRTVSDRAAALLVERGEAEWIGGIIEVKSEPLPPAPKRKGKKLSDASDSVPMDNRDQSYPGTGSDNAEDGE